MDNALLKQRQDEVKVASDLLFAIEMVETTYLKKNHMDFAKPNGGVGRYPSTVSDDVDELLVGLNAVYDGWKAQKLKKWQEKVDTLLGAYRKD